MGAETSIEWAHHTWNPWYGCTPVSEGCEHCYALRRMTQLKRVKGPGDIRRASKATWRFPLSKKVKSGDRVFVCSWSDFFHEDVPEEWRWDALDIIDERPDVTFLLLTKRTDAMREWVEMITADSGTSHEEEGWIRKNRHIWLGFTAENQRRFDERWPIFDSIEWPGKKFVSLEPMLGPIVLPAGFERHKVDIDLQTMCAVEDSRRVLDWVIAGGESGPNARPMNPEWARGVRDQCVEAGVPFFFKQWGAWSPTVDDNVPCGIHRLDSAGRVVSETPGLWEDTDTLMQRVGKKRAGRLLDGRTWDEVPK